MFDIGVMFWAGREPRELLAELLAMNVRSGQLGLPGDMALEDASGWKDALECATFQIHTVFAAFDGESYVDIAAVRKTVGFVPHGTRSERESRMLAVSDFAARLGVRGIATHLGYIYEDYGAMRDLVRRICDHAAQDDQTFALETGQERAEALRAFVREVDRPNLGINFDPANMLMYGSGDPLEAFAVLAPYLLSMHAKDGDWPAEPGALGQERVFGEGSLGLEGFVRRVMEYGYEGPIAVEREGSCGQKRLREIGDAVALLRGLTSRVVPEKV